MVFAKNKKAQFFVISIVLVALAFFAIFLFFQASEQTSVTLFQPSSSLDLQNTINSVQQRNTWVQDYWKNLTYRKYTNKDIDKGAITMSDQVYRELLEVMKKRGGGYAGLDIPEFFTLVEKLFTPEEAAVNNAMPRGPFQAKDLAESMGRHQPKGADHR